MISREARTSGRRSPAAAISDTLTGWTVGAGCEHAWTNHFTTRIEYRYTDYGRASGESVGRLSRA